MKLSPEFSLIFLSGLRLDANWLVKIRNAQSIVIEAHQLVSPNKMLEFEVIVPSAHMI